ncbi:MAG: cytochrome-c peroxidase [Sphingobacteriaceae bacterium]|nr:cytochrome-c peroxidase [Sphingobacteriaceae bacterium]
MRANRTFDNYKCAVLGLVTVLLVSCGENTSEKPIYTEEALGEALFFDPILSRDTSVSCATCHKAELAFADNTPTSKGVFGRSGNRNTPSAMNQTDRNFYFWDGRAETLEEQALGPIENPVEMDLPLSIAIQRLLKSEKYKKAFQQVYGKDPSISLLAQAIANYERTLDTGNSPFDKYMRGKDTTQFSESAKRGLTIFNEKGKCFDCHFGVDFTGNDQFKNIGIYNGKDLNDKGRYDVTQKESDLGKFKIPGLRNIALTAPYMHNGMHKTLREVIDYYDTPDKFINNSINRDTLLSKPLGLSEGEKKDLENFLLSLTDERFTKKENKEDK